MPAAIAQVKDPHAEELGIVAPIHLEIECDAFTGTLATLVHCVRNRRVDLLQVPLLPICEAYLAYLIESSAEDLDGKASAMLGLAYLLERKAYRLVFERDQEEDDAPDIEGPEPYISEFALAIQALQERLEQREHRFFRSATEGAYELPFQIGAVTSLDLARALERALHRANPDPPERLSESRRSLAEQMVVVLAQLDGEPRHLDELLPPEFTVGDVVYWFMALLELIRLGQARVALVGEDVKFLRGESA